MEKRAPQKGTLFQLKKETREPPPRFFRETILIVKQDYSGRHSDKKTLKNKQMCNQYNDWQCNNCSFDKYNE